MFHKRVRIILTAERLELLQRGKQVKLSQNGMKFIVVPILGCCTGMRMLIKSNAKLARTFKSCPYCKQELAMNGYGNPVYVKKSCSLRGCKRVKDENGKYHWVKPGGSLDTDKR